MFAISCVVIILAADATLSTSEIIRHVVDRKLNVNHNNAKKVDELGLADVRYYVCDDPEGDLLSQGLGDRDDASVNNLVSMILEDYPFEHNLFVGGVKAEDVKVKKAPPASPQSSADNVSSGGDKEKDTGVGANINVKRRDGGASKVPHSADPLHEENIGLDVPTLLRRAADAYEEKVIPMFEGYMLSLKGHLDKEVGVLQTDLKTVTKSIRGLDAKVSTEFEKIRTLIKCGGYSEDDPAGGGTSPYRQTSPYGSGPDDLPPLFVPPQHTTRMYPAPGGGESSSPPDVSAPSEDSIPHPSDTVPPAVHTRGVTIDSWNDSNVPQPPSSVQKETTNVQSATKEVQSTEAEAHPTKVTSVHPPVQSQPRGDEEIASPTEPIPHESQSGKEQEDPTAESSIFPDVSEVVTKILADSGISKDIPQSTSMSGTVGGVSSSSNPKVPLKAQEIPQAGSPSGKVGGQSTSNDPNVPLNAEAVSESPVVGQTQRQVWFEEKSDVGVPKDDGDASKEVERRHSTRTTRKTKKFTPPAPPPKKGANKKPPKPAESNAQAAKRSKKAAAESSQPTPTPSRTDLPVFIGGFNAFTPPSAADREAFLKRLSWSTPLSTTFAGLKDLFQCTGVCTHETLDRVVHTLRMRRDRLPGPRFDFFPPSFYVEFVRNHSGFEATIDKTTFSFSPTVLAHLHERPAWYKEVDFVYTPVLIKNSHWVGVIIDLHMSAIYVVDFNQACPSEFDVVGVLTPISVMLPYLIHKHCIIPGTRQTNFMPFPISRIQVPMLLEHPGYSAVAALILLEVAAAGKPLTDISGTEADVRQAAENYAIAALRIY
ncbi:hypothetical protein Bca101_018261 [Brassica carinata]